MRNVLKTNSADETRELERDETSRLRHMVRIAAAPRSDVNSGYQIDRIDALRILIRSLLDQLDYLTEPGEWQNVPDLSLQGMVHRFEVELIRQALVRTGGRQRQAARLLGEKKTTFNAKIIRYGITVDPHKSDSEA